jgi:hypothetical protein
LEGQGSVIVLGREAKAALELSQHPKKLGKLIRSGSLFTVTRGTAVKLVQGNRPDNGFVIKVRITEGTMAGQEGWVQPGQARSSPPGDAVNPSPPMAGQEHATEVALGPQATKPIANRAIFAEPNPISGIKTIEPDPTSTSAAPRLNQIPRLEGKGSVIVLGREAKATLELSQHPERLSKLIQSGSLFTVPRGTAIKLLQGNRFGSGFVIRVRIMEGSKTGQEGWAQLSQVSP